MTDGDKMMILIKCSFLKIPYDAYLRGVAEAKLLAGPMLP